MNGERFMGPVMNEIEQAEDSAMLSDVVNASVRDSIRCPRVVRRRVRRVVRKLATSGAVEVSCLRT